MKSKIWACVILSIVSTWLYSCWVIYEDCMADIVACQAKLPPPATIDLHHFSGRIIPGEYVHPGTFYISVPLEKIQGKDAIASYTYSNGEDGVANTWVCVEAWMPDPKTPGVFQKGWVRKSASELWNNHCLMVKDVSLKDGVISISAGKTMSVWFSIVAHSFFVVLPPFLAFLFLAIINHNRYMCGKHPIFFSRLGCIGYS
jgi:hypothetical protein